VQQLVERKLNPELIQIFKNAFARTTSCFGMIMGRRESGKTDMAFLISEIVYFTGVIKNVATNVKVYDSPFPIERITNLEDLRHWCRTVQGRKLYLFDEMGKSMRRRTPMASLNIKMLDDLQILRKYRLSLIGIAPADIYVDSAVFGSDLLDWIVIKNRESQKVALYKDLMEDIELIITDIPPTSIKFDTWDVAPFKEKANPELTFKEKNLELLWQWCNGASWNQLGFKHPQQFNRFLRKNLKKLLESINVTSHTLEREDIMDETYSQNPS